MQNIAGSLNEILKVIADTLGCSVEFIKQNGMEYLLEFGKYKYISTIPRHVLEGVFLGGLICLVVALVLFGLIEYKIQTNTKRIWVAILFTLLFIITSSIPLGIETMKFKSSPNIYSIEKAYDMINKK
jgi:hypothetical protein